MTRHPNIVCAAILVPCIAGLMLTAASCRTPDRTAATPPEPVRADNRPVFRTPDDVYHPRRQKAPETDVRAAIHRALQWLRENQSEDGSWGDAHGVSSTGLALLSMLGHGGLLDHADYRPSMERAVRALLTSQTPDGRYGDGGAVRLPYDHALATRALSEWHVFTGDAGVRESLERAVQVILAAQQPGGGWHYGYARGERRSTSVTAAQVEALFASAMAGLDRPRIASAMDRALADLASVQDPDTGRFGELFRGVGLASVSGAAVYAWQLAGAGRAYEARLGVMSLEDAVRAWPGAPQWPLHETYGITQALYHQGGLLWDQWRTLYVPELLRHQNEDGSWPAPGREAEFGTAYATALGALILQVPRRMRSLNAMMLEDLPAPLWAVENREGTTSHVLADISLRRPDVYLIDRRIVDRFETADTLVVETDMRRAMHLGFGTGPQGDREDAERRRRMVSALLTGLAESDGADEASLHDHFRWLARGEKVFIELLSASFVVDLPEEWYSPEEMSALETQWPALLGELRAAWEEGDAERMEAVIARMGAPMHAEHISEYNQQAADALEERLRDGRSHFVVLGAGRWLGPEGVLAQLRKRGYRIRQVP